TIGPSPKALWPMSLMPSSTIRYSTPASPSTSRSNRFNALGAKFPSLKRRLPLMPSFSTPRGAKPCAPCNRSASTLGHRRLVSGVAQRGGAGRDGDGRLTAERGRPVAFRDDASVRAAQSDVPAADHERLCADLVGKTHAYETAAHAGVHDLTQRRLWRELCGS